MKAIVLIFTLCVAVSAAANSYHPDIVKSQVVTLDAAAIERNAQSGTPFDLNLGETQVQVTLTPNPIWEKEGLTVLLVDRDKVKEVTIPGNVTYSGDVAGEDPAASEVRLTIAHGALEGYVSAKAGWWFIEPLTRFDPKAGANEYLVYATRDLDFVLDYGDDGVKGDQIFDPPVFTDPRIPISLVADKNYVDRSGPAFEWIDNWAALLNNVNGIYRDQFGKEFRMGKGLADLGGTFLTSSAHAMLLVQLESIIGQNGGFSGLKSHFAHLTTGKDLNGDVLGTARNPGRTGLSQQRPAAPGTRLAFQNMILAAHMIGLNFNAVHSQADRWCAFEVGFVCAAWFQTLEHPVFRQFTVPRFSNGSIVPSHNNAQRICNEMIARGFAPCPQP